MAQRILIIILIGVRAAGAGVGGIALCRTGGRRDLTAVIVTQLGNGLGIAVTAVTAGEGLDTIGGTGSGGGHLAAVAMAQRILISILISIAAVGTGVRSVALCGTGGGSHHAGIVMTQLGDGRIEVEAAIGGGLPGPPLGAVGGTGGRLLGRGGVIGGSQLGQGLGIRGGAAGALALNGAGGTLGGSLGHGIIGVIMAQSGAGGHTTDGAGCRCGTAGIAIVMAVGRNGHGEAVAAVGGGLPGILAGTGGGTGGLLGHGVSVIRGVQLGQRHRGLAGAAGAGAGEGTAGAGGGLLGHAVAVGMTQCILISILISIGAAGAGMGGVALSGTGGSRHGAGVAVAQLGDGLGVAVRALGAGVGLHTVSGAGGGLGHSGGIAVAGGCLFITVLGSTAGAGVDRVALGGTGGGNNRTRGIGVGMGVGDDQHIGVVDEGEVVGTAGGHQSAVTAPIGELPTDVGSGGGGIPDFTVVTQPGAVLDKLELIGAGRQGHTICIAAAGPGHGRSRPSVEVAGQGHDLGITAAGALAAGVAVAGGSD